MYCWPVPVFTLRRQLDFRRTDDPSPLARYGGTHRVPEAEPDEASDDHGAAKGNEEVVRDGVNGLVFPTGDVEALAERMRKLILDRDLLEQLSKNIRNDSIKLLSDQVTRTEVLYKKLLSDESC